MPVDMLRGPLGGGVVAAQVYCVGILLTSANDELQIRSDGGDPPGRGGACCAMAMALMPKASVHPHIIRMPAYPIFSMSPKSATFLFRAGAFYLRERRFGHVENARIDTLATAMRICFSGPPRFVRVVS